VDHVDPEKPLDLAAELLQLRQQLQMKDQLVAQLSSELFRSIQAHPPALPAQSLFEVGGAQDSPDSQDWQQQLQVLQAQIDQRDAQINQLQCSCQSLSDRNQILEHVIQELPEVYRKKFSDRLDQVKTKVQSLQMENQRLQSQLQQSGRSLPEPRGFTRRLLPSFRNSPDQKA
jgi:hypothetical protein